jgi:aminodeoxyfutalosine synthase
MPTKGILFCFKAKPPVTLHKMPHMSTSIDTLINITSDTALKTIAEKVKLQIRISDEEGIILFERASLPFVGALANFIREKLHGDTTYFNRNFHIEPTNVCVFSCKFCSYSRLYAKKEEGWDLALIKCWT